LNYLLFEIAAVNSSEMNENKKSKYIISCPRRSDGLVVSSTPTSRMAEWRHIHGVDMGAAGQRELD